jgi:hypothetical protein
MDAGYSILDAGCSMPFRRRGYNFNLRSAALGRKFVSPYIGEAGSEKAFGGKSLGQRRLRDKLRLLRRQKWWRRLKNIFVN